MEREGKGIPLNTFRIVLNEKFRNMQGFFEQEDILPIWPSSLRQSFNIVRMHIFGDNIFERDARKRVAVAENKREWEIDQSERNLTK